MELRHKAGNERRGTTRIHTARRARRGIEGPVLEWTRHAGQARTRGDILGLDSTDTAGHAIGKAAEATLGATTQVWAMQAMKVTDSLGAPGTGRQRQRSHREESRSIETRGWRGQSSRDREATTSRRARQARKVMTGQLRAAQSSMGEHRTGVTRCFRRVVERSHKARRGRDWRGIATRARRTLVRLGCVRRQLAMRGRQGEQTRDGERRDVTRRGAQRRRQHRRDIARLGTAGRDLATRGVAAKAIIGNAAHVAPWLAKGGGVDRQARIVWDSRVTAWQALQVRTSPGGIAHG